MKIDSLQYFMHDGPAAFRLELAGLLCHHATLRLEAAWRKASLAMGVRRRIVDITFVTGADQQGRALLARWHREGAQLIADSPSSVALAESILGQPVLPPPPSPRVAAHRTWLPFRAAFLASLLAAFAFPLVAPAATLRPETVAAWDDYLQTVNASLHQRVASGGNFLWTLEDAGRAARVHRGEILTVPAPGQNPRRVPGGLIHHWLGAAFLPDLQLDDLLALTRDYDRYKEFYNPSVVDSKSISRTGRVDEFSMRLMSQTFFMKSALDADYRAANVRLDDRRFYSVSGTTRVQEIEDYGQPGQHRIPEGEGAGYIWKLHSILRVEQRNGGLYLEVEAIALSRDIPGPFRFAVEPIVRRVSRNSLLTMLQQTREALHRPVAVQAATPRPQKKRPATANAFVGQP